MPALPPLRDENPLISYPFLDKRHEFLRLCQGNYLPYVGEDLLKEIYQESLKPKPTRSVGLLTDCDV